MDGFFNLNLIEEGLAETPESIVTGVGAVVPENLPGIKRI